MCDAFKLSEEVKLPVIVRITTDWLIQGQWSAWRQWAQNELNPETDKRNGFASCHCTNSYVALFEMQRFITT